MPIFPKHRRSESRRLSEPFTCIQSQALALFRRSSERQDIRPMGSESRKHSANYPGSTQNRKSRLRQCHVPEMYRQEEVRLHPQHLISTCEQQLQKPPARTVAAATKIERRKAQEAAPSHGVAAGDAGFLARNSNSRYHPRHNQCILCWIYSGS